MPNQQQKAGRQPKQARQAGKHRQNQPPDPYRIGKIPARQRKAADPCNRHHNQRRRRNQLGLHGRRSNHQAADDRHRLPDGLGQLQAGLLQNLKCQQQKQDLQDGREGAPTACSQ